jgi:hypothetical protein
MAGQRRFARQVEGQYLCEHEASNALVVVVDVAADVE